MSLIKKITMLVLLLSYFFITTKTFDVNSLNREITSNAYTQKDDLTTIVSTNLDLNGFEKVSTNSYTELYVHKASLAIRVKNLETGYIWSSNFTPEEGELNTTWKDNVNSAAIITYYDIQARNTQNEERTAITNTNTKVTSYQAITNYKNEINGFSAILSFKQSQIKFKLVVKLVNNKLEIEVPNESIVENERYKLGMLRIYPFFGATKENSKPGYIFIPDGSGALMRFKEADKLATIYQNKFYNTDFAYTNTLAYDDSGLKLPVYGMIHGVNQHGYYNNIVNGAECANLVVYPAGNTTNYYFTYPEFFYRQKYQLPTSKNGIGKTGLPSLQEIKETFDIKMSYGFLSSDASYVGIAKNYQQDLIKEGILTNLEKEDNISIQLQIIGGVKQPGAIFDKMVKMTTFKQADDILTKIQNNGITNFDATFVGWSKGGYAQDGPNYFPINKKLGSKKEFKKLIEKYTTSTTSFALQANYSTVTKYSSYRPIKDLSQRANRQLLNSFMFYDEEKYLNYNSMQKYFAKDVKDYSNYGVKTIEPYIGKILYSDYSNGFVNKSQSIEKIQSTLELYDGNYNIETTAKYLLKYAKNILYTPTYSSGEAKFTDTVPFTQMVLHGYVKMYGHESNNFANQEMDLLRRVEYGVYPLYQISHDYASKLQKTNLAYIMSSRFTDWEDIINYEYNFINGALKNTNNQTMVNRVVLDDGVIEVTYSNNTKVIVNYLDTDYNTIHGIVKAKNYLVKRGND